MEKRPEINNNNALDNASNVKSQEVDMPIMDISKTKKFSTMAVIIMAVLMLAGVCFGVYMYYSPVNCVTETAINNANSDCLKCEECMISEDDESRDAVEYSATNTESVEFNWDKAGVEPSELPDGVVESLERYHVYLNGKSKADVPFWSIVDNFHNLTEDAKEMYLFVGMYMNKEYYFGGEDRFDTSNEWAPSGVFSYDEINDLYHKTFGGGTDIRRQGMKSNKGCTPEVKYDSERDEFQIYEYIFCGSNGPFDIYYKISSYAIDGDYIKLNLLSIKVYSEISDYYKEENFENTMNMIVDGMDHYVLTLKKQDDAYILIDAK